MARTKSKSREQSSSELEIIDIDDDVDEEEAFHVGMVIFSARLRNTVLNHFRSHY